MFYDISFSFFAVLLFFVFNFLLDEKGGEQKGRRGEEKKAEERENAFQKELERS